MSEQHPSIQRVVRGVQAFNEGDLETAARFVSQDIVYRVSGKGPFAGEYHGFDEFYGLLKRVKELSGGTVSLDVKTMLGDETAVMWYARATAQRDGKSLDHFNAYYYRLDEDGMVIEGMTIPVDQYAFDEFWS